MARRSTVISVAVVACLLCFLDSFARADGLNVAFESISVNDIRAHIDILADDAMEGREAGTRGGRAAAAYLERQLAEVGLKPGGDGDGFIQKFADGSYRNVLAILEGSDPALKHEYVLVGAHYDHVGYGTSRNSRGPWGQIHNGADDNASGVAGVLEIAQAVTFLATPPRRSILFAFWDGEEKGLLGSRYWCSQPTVSLQAVVLAFNADMIGRLRGEKLHVYGTRTARGLRRWISEQNQATDLALEISWELKAHSDHYPLVEREIPALMLHTGLHDEWHRPTDDVEKINHEGISATTRLLFSLIVDAANRPNRFAFRQDSRAERSADLARLENTGPPRPPRLGIAWAPEDVTSPGVTLTCVTPGTPADRAGLQIGDRLVRFSDADTAEDSHRLGVAIWAAHSPATAVVQRAGEILEIPVELDGQPLRYGISWREDEGEPGTVVLSEVVSLSAAYLAGLQVGDRIYRVADRDFRDGNELAQQLLTLPSPVSLRIERNGRLRTISIDAPSVP
jgi:hypothetical protein